jgi:2-hydroxychromene-2-carboxylate isomerase
MPMAMRGQAVPQAKRIHTVRDVKREADRLGMPFGHVYDPIGEGAVRCLAIGVHATDLGRERDWVLNVSRGIWAEARDVTDDSVLQPICEASGLEWAACQASMSDPAIAERVDRDSKQLVELGQWGVPVLRFGEHFFWGQDRIEDLEQILLDHGLLL